MEVHQFFCRAFPSKQDLAPGSCDQIESGPGSEPLLLPYFRNGTEVQVYF